MLLIITLAGQNLTFQFYQLLLGYGISRILSPTNIVYSIVSPLFENGLGKLYVTGKWNTMRPRILVQVTRWQVT
jgi:hypothetical protein